MNPAAGQNLPQIPDQLPQPIGPVQLNPPPEPVDFVDNLNPDAGISVYGIVFHEGDCFTYDDITIYKLARIMYAAIPGLNNPQRLRLNGIGYREWNPNTQKFEPEVGMREFVLPDEQDMLIGVQPAQCPVAQAQNNNVQMEGGRKKRKNRKSRKAKRKSRKARKASRKNRKH